MSDGADWAEDRERYGMMQPEVSRLVYVVAASRKEAECLAVLGWESRVGAEAHLKECREPPTDPFYGNKLSIYAVQWRKR